ncbi:hypothetical protein EMCRGX_G001954 [Ephydatia muelleri]
MLNVARAPLSDIVVDKVAEPPPQKSTKSNAIVTVGAGERHVCSELQADLWNMNHEQEPSLKQKRTIMSADYIKAKLILVRETLGDNQKSVW